MQDQIQADQFLKRRWTVEVVHTASFWTVRWRMNLASANTQHQATAYLARRLAHTWTAKTRTTHLIESVYKRPAPTSVSSTTGPHQQLPADGSSRGNPGIGGSGSVLVSIDQFGQATIQWIHYEYNAGPATNNHVSIKRCSVDAGTPQQSQAPNRRSSATAT